MQKCVIKERYFASSKKIVAFFFNEDNLRASINRILLGLVKKVGTLFLCVPRPAFRCGLLFLYPGFIFYIYISSIDSVINQYRP